MDDFPNDPGTNGRLHLGQSIAASFTPTGFFDEFFHDGDWFRLSATANRSYVVYSSGDTVQVDIGQFDSANAAIDDRNYIGGFPSNGYLIFTAKESRDYFVSASNLFQEGGSYNLIAFDYEIPGGIKTSMFLGDAVAEANTIEVASDADYFRVSFEKGVAYEIQIKGTDSGRGTLTDPKLEVRNGNGTFMQSQDDGGVGRDARLEFTAPYSGSFFLNVMGAESGTGTYEIVATEIDLVDDAATGPQTNSRIELQNNRTTSKAGKLGISSDIDWHKVELIAGRWYQFGSDVTDVQPYLLLRDPDNDVVFQDRNQGNFFFRAQQSGTHHFIFRNGDPNYTLFVTDNARPPISSFQLEFELFGNSTVSGDELFSLNDFPADQIQVISEAPFEVDGINYERFQLHTFDADQIPEITFSGQEQRGAYDINWRVLGGGTNSGWAQIAVSSRENVTARLDGGAIWNAGNTELESDEVITFRFPDSAPSYFPADRFTGVEKVSPAVEQIFRKFFVDSPAHRSGYDLNLPTLLNRKFVYSDSETADIQIFTAANRLQPAIGHRPGKFGFGDIILDNRLFAGDASPQPETLDHYYLVRAVAAAIGIKHFVPDYNREQSVAGTSISGIMSARYLESFGAHDLEFLRENYGPAQKPAVTQNQYRFGTGIRTFTRTLNTVQPNAFYDATESTQVSIDLRDGAQSYVVGGFLRQSYSLAQGNTINVAFGSSGDDQMIGNHGDNLLEGGAGNDILMGLSGDDRLRGGFGDDLYLYESGDGNDTIRERVGDRHFFQTAGGTDTLQIKGKFGMDRLEDDLTFQRLGDSLRIDFELNGQYNLNNGFITIENMQSATDRIEKLDLRNFSQELGVISLPSIWANVSNEKQRFLASSDSDAFGLIAVPV